MASCVRLKKHLKEDEDFFIAPGEHAIYEAKTLEPLGQLADTAFNWDGDVLRKFFPSLNIIQLKKDTLNSQPGGRRRR